MQDLIDGLGGFLVFIFTIEWGTVSLIEVWWTFQGILGVCLSLMVIIRGIKNIRALDRSINVRIIRMRDDISIATYDLTVRAVFKGIIFLPCIFSGILAMNIPQLNVINSGSAVAGLTVITMETLLLATLVFDEIAFQRLIRRRRTARKRRTDR